MQQNAPSDVSPPAKDDDGVNARSWEYANRVFNAHKADYAAAIRSGAEVLPPEFLDALAPTSSDRILHLMCNDGREAAYISHISGAHVLGVDFSPAAIDFARQLNADLGFNNHFVTEEVIEYLSQSDQEYNPTKISLTLGSLRWISDPSAFFRLTRRLLGPDGALIIWDFHPLLSCFDRTLRVTHDYPFRTRTYLRDVGVRDYLSDEAAYTLVARQQLMCHPSFDNPHRVWFSEHSLATLISTAVQNSIFILDRLDEYEFSWEERCVPWLTQQEGRRFRAPESTPTIPVTFLLRFLTSSERATK